MELSLRPHTQQLIEEKLKEGVYKSADDVVNAAMEALIERDSFSFDNDTLDAIDRAEDAIEGGHIHEWKDIRHHVRAMFSDQ